MRAEVSAPYPWAITRRSHWLVRRRASGGNMKRTSTRLLGLGLAVVLLGAISSKEKAAVGQVTMCHFGHTLVVPIGAIGGHLTHGDTFGACGGYAPGSWTR